ncbi:UNVERIFIED_CONTAM: hypothetical protein HDU68_005312 [Siphonaria sp. JEL0065]|nr:hypothetical protein HDU68_005312 [Siphonaria sp. JEL0065]
MALPYIDKEYDNELVKGYVNKLIQDELKTMGPNKTPLPGSDIPLFESNASLSSLFASSGKGSQINVIDISRFRLEPPANISSEEDWKRAVDNARAQIQHQENRLVNLELLSKFGANAWKLSNFQVEAVVKGLRVEVEDQRRELLELNKERKGEQTRAGSTLNQLEEKWKDLVDRVLRVDIANQVLEVEIESLQQLVDQQQQQIQQ